MTWEPTAPCVCGGVRFVRRRKMMQIEQHNRYFTLYRNGISGKSCLRTNYGRDSRRVPGNVVEDVWSCTQCGKVLHKSSTDRCER